MQTASRVPRNVLSCPLSASKAPFEFQMPSLPKSELRPPPQLRLHRGGRSPTPESLPRPLRVSIVTTTRNCAATLGETLASVARQTYPHREHIVVDAASTDDTWRIVERHQGQLDRMTSEPDRGIYDGLNKGIAQATGDIVGLLHGDDLYPDANVLSRVVEAFADPDIDIVYGDLNYVGSERTEQVVRYWQAGAFRPSALRRGWIPPHPAVFVRRAVYERFGHFDLSYGISSDYDFMLRIFTAIPDRIAYLPEVLVHMRVGGTSNRSLRQVLRGSLQDLRIMRSHGVGGLASVAMKSLSKIPQFIRRKRRAAAPTAVAATEGLGPAPDPAITPIPGD